MSARIRAGSLHANEPLLVVDSQGSGAMCVPGDERKLVILIRDPPRAGLFLREIDAAVRRAHKAIGIIGSLPEELPFEAPRNHSRDFASGHVFGRRRLGKAAPTSRCGATLPLL